MKYCSKIWLLIFVYFAACNNASENNKKKGDALYTKACLSCHSKDASITGEMNIKQMADLEPKKFVSIVMSINNDSIHGQLFNGSNTLTQQDLECLIEFIRSYGNGIIY